jgi:hypothetical protein
VSGFLRKNNSRMICLVVLSPLEEDGGLVGLVVLCSQQEAKSVFISEHNLGEPKGQLCVSGPDPLGSVTFGLSVSGSGSVTRCYGSASGSFLFVINIMLHSRRQNEGSVLRASYFFRLEREP